MSKKGLINRIFLENRNLLEKIMKKENLSKKQIKSELMTYLINLKTPLYLSNDDRKTFKIKDVYEFLPVKLGWYEFKNEQNLDLESFVQQCAIDPTQKGREIYEEYKRIISK